MIKQKVLFLCTHNSSRTQMAEGSAGGGRERGSEDFVQKHG
ncbi:MAG TPA: hypothetical protein VMH80_00970 [Bryobacteraceae bacterium]|nr:hypothetical protein [Bryobacteraceae bacterium]